MSCLKTFFLAACCLLNAGMRDPRWPALRHKYIVVHPGCECCGTLKAPQVHHVIPVHKDPSKELDYSNLITLCKGGCHLKVGHGGSYKFYNPNCREDAALILHELSKQQEVMSKAKKNRLPNQGEQDE
jgi:hypothetical protein